MILAVAGGKGGVGTSTVARVLGERLGAVVVDAGLGTGERGVEPTLADALAGRADPLAAVRGDEPKRLPAGGTLAAARAADVRRLGTALQAVEREHDRVVVDCPSGLSSVVGGTLLAAEGVVLVTAPDDPAVVGALRVRALARRLDAGLVRVVYNRAERAPDGVRRAFGAPVVALPDDRSVARATGPGAGPPLEGAVADRFDALARAAQCDCNSS